MIPYRVLIADDEHYIRKRIIKIFPWERFPLEFAGEAENGAEIIKMMKSGVDLVVLDIRMPDMDGLEAARLISQKYPETKIIFLSGYDDFSYAQSALRYGAVGYLLKPAQKEELSELVGKAVKMLSLERERSEKIANFDSYVRGREYRVARTETASPEEASVYCAFVGFYIFGKYADRQKTIMREFANRGLKFQPIRETANTVIFHFFLDDAKDAIYIGKTAEDIVRDINAPVYCIAGSVFHMNEPWREYYRQVSVSLLKRFFAILPSCGTPQTEDERNQPQFDIMKIRQKIVFFVNTRDREGYDAFLGNILAAVSESQDCRLFWRAMSEWSATLSLLDANAVQAADLTTSALLDENYSMDGVRDRLSDFCHRLIDQKSAVPSDIVISQKITSFINERFADQDLSVAKIAERFGMNISYIGAVFKRVRNLSINQYITSVRMEFAATMLLDGKHRISEIAEKSGYSDVFYFSKRFKSVYGESPREYLLNSLAYRNSHF